MGSYPLNNSEESIQGDLARRKEANKTTGRKCSAGWAGGRFETVRPNDWQ